jgi:DNA polymerase
MNEELGALLEELQRLKREGVATVFVSDEALGLLRAAVAGSSAGGSVAPAPAAVVEASGARLMPGGPVAAGEPAGRASAETFRGALAAASSAPAKPDAGRGESDAAPGRLPPPPVFEIPPGTKRERWEWLRHRVLECPVCRAHAHGHKVVFGVGNIDAGIFFCGEAPGGEEEIQGEPFVGPAGQLLNKMIGAMGLRRDDVYIGNILNWRPEMEGRLDGTAVRQVGNRPPTGEEIRFGLPYLRGQVDVVKPKVIVALGSTAAEGLLGPGSFASLGAVRGRWHVFDGTPLMVTYHPSYLLRNASNRTKRIVWEDLMQVMEKAGLSISEKQRGYFL